MKPNKELERLAEIIDVKYHLFKKTNSEIRGKKLSDKFLEIVNNIYINENVYRTQGMTRKTFLREITKILNRNKMFKKLKEEQTQKKSSKKVKTEAEKAFLRKSKREAKAREKEFLAEQKLLGRDQLGDPLER